MFQYDNPDWLKDTYNRLGTIRAVAIEAKTTPRIIVYRLIKFRIPFKHNTAKGYRTHNTAGYVLILDKGHPGATKGGYVYEHRLAMERKLGRFLQPNENVHHLNGNPSDNRIENLVLMTTSEHRHAHMSADGLQTISRSKQTEILALREQGWLVAKIAEKVDLSDPTVTKILLRYPIECRQCKRTFKNLKALGMHITRSH